MPEIDVKAIEEAQDKAIAELKVKLEAEVKEKVKYDARKRAEYSLNFIRKFRWTFSAPHLSSNSMKSCSIHTTDKKIYLEIYPVLEDGRDTPFAEWRKNWDDVAEFSSFDGSGVEIEKYQFSGLELVSHQVDFDYSSSDVASDKVILSYKNCIRTFLYNKNN